LENFLETLTFSVVFIVIAFVFLAIGWLITGKQKIRGGTCGRDPTKERDKNCATKSRCQLCDSNKKPKKEEKSEEKTTNTEDK